MKVYRIRHGFFNKPGEDTIVLAPSMEQAILKYKYAVKKDLENLVCDDKELEASLKKQPLDPKNIELLSTVIIK